MKKIYSLATVFIVLAFGCSRSPYNKTNKIYKKQAKEYSKEIRQQPAGFDDKNLPWVGTTNFSIRKPNYVIIHHTAQNSCEETLQTFTRPTSQVSAHYVICKDGTVYHMLNDYLRAWQAGISKWGSLTDINSSSVGIEIDNNGFQTFTEPQINSLLILLDTLKRRYTIPTANFIGHADIAPTRKVDPNVTFPWKLLSQHGFGLWYDEVRDTLPANFNSIQALKIIGYDVKDTAAVIKTFKRKFLQDEKNIVIDDTTKSILYNLMKKNL